MTIRGTSNQSISSMTRTVKRQGIELGPGPNGGGAGFKPDGAVEYSESNNPASGSGTYFTHAGEHLADGTPQVNVVV